MPIYAYLCEACGHRQDVLQKLSDPVLSSCPACGAPRFVKQLTAAGFQLKGSGWYATDFRGGPKPAADDGKSPPKSGDTAAAPDTPAAAPAAPATAANDKPPPAASDAA